jgi:hypothetical protein
MAEHEEIEEHIHHAQEPFDKVVAGTMAIIAALLAVVSVLGQHFNTEKLLNQQLSSDEWAFYQAKNIRRYTAQTTHDLLVQLKGGSDAIDKYAKEQDRYDHDLEQLKDKAQDLEKERDKVGHQADRFHLGEVFLEVAIVLSSLAILSKRKLLFIVGATCAIVGLLIAATGYWA